MLYRIDVYPSRCIPVEEFIILRENSASILLGNNPSNFPIIPIETPKYLLDKTNEVLPEKDYEPKPKQYQNLRRLSFEKNEAEVNLTNYDSMTAIRRMLRLRNYGKLDVPYGRDGEEDLIDLTRQIALFGFSGILLTPQEEAIIARRSQRVQIHGVYQPYPGGNMEYSSDFAKTVMEEAREEGSLTQYDLIRKYVIGLARSMWDAGNPGLVVYLETRRHRRELKNMINPDEHDPESLQSVRTANRTHFKEDLIRFWPQSAGSGNGAMLVLGARLFGEDYFHDLIKELNKTYGTQIIVNNPFGV